MEAFAVLLCIQARFVRGTFVLWFSYSENMDCSVSMPRWDRQSWCTDCFEQDHLDLQLCVSCHPETKDRPTESRAKYSKRVQDRCYTTPPLSGNEPSLQQHVFFDCPHDETCYRQMPGKESLPTYSPRPEFLSALHCRLCLRPCVEEGTPQLADASVKPETVNRGVHPSVLQHAKDYHGLEDADAYRRAVLTRVQKQWPQTVTAQEMRLSYDR